MSIVLLLWNNKWTRQIASLPQAWHILSSVIIIDSNSTLYGVHSSTLYYPGDSTGTWWQE